MHFKTPATVQFVGLRSIFDYSVVVDMTILYTRFSHVSVENVSLRRPFLGNRRLELSHVFLVLF